ncbi:hypothetical protein NDU88_002560 [Pleurodeles waltl]|uniref:Uncharacterized protein n=1 Tax=Pleurodeles waltl TaxID=8319 RepID=A0AAV7TLG4_PLEWA|nr:hypothetical protein NDU88_002560 [Pleurodeles waltl]
MTVRGSQPVTHSNAGARATSCAALSRPGQESPDTSVCLPARVPVPGAADATEREVPLSQRALASLLALCVMARSWFEVTFAIIAICQSRTDVHWYFIRAGTPALSFVFLAGMLYYSFLPVAK